MKLKLKRPLFKPGTDASTPQRSSGLMNAFSRLSPREQVWVEVAAALLLAALLVSVGVLPAWRTLQSAPAKSAQLDAQLKSMQALQARAQALQTQPKREPDTSAPALKEATTRLLGPSAQLSVNEQRANATLQAVTPANLAQWLQQARMSAGAVPSEAHLKRSPAVPQAAVGWDGAVVLVLPQR